MKRENQQFNEIRLWVIRNKESGDYWSNDDGWTQFLQCANFYTDIQKAKANLPLFGDWLMICKVYDNA